MYRATWSQRGSHCVFTLQPTFLICFDPYPRGKRQAQNPFNVLDALWLTASYQGINRIHLSEFSHHALTSHQFQWLSSLIKWSCPKYALKVCKPVPIKIGVVPSCWNFLCICYTVCLVYVAYHCITGWQLKCNERMHCCCMYCYMQRKCNERRPYSMFSSCMNGEPSSS